MNREYKVLPNVLNKVFKENSLGKDYIVGDIHGEYKKLFKQLKELDFDFAHDRLFSCGDFIDRGDFSLECTELLAQPWFFAVMGNHEQLMLEAEPAHLKCYYKAQKLDEDILVDNIAHAAWLLHCANGGKWAQALTDVALKSINKSILTHCPLSITIELGEKRVGITHAAAPNDWQTLLPKNGEETVSLDIDKHGDLAMICMWDRQQFQGAQKGKPHPVKNISKVVHGHVNCATPEAYDNQIWIDTVYKSGDLTILELSALCADVYS